MRDDFLIFGPDAVDLSRSPLRATLGKGEESGAAETYVLGAFNPGLARLPGGNLLLMVRVAEALRAPVVDGHARTIRWRAEETGGPGRFGIDRHPTGGIEMHDPRHFTLRDTRPPVIGLTSLSWLLPVEISGDGQEVVAVHYDKAIAPHASCAEYGIEDARISLVGGCWWMTVCAVSSERHCTMLYRSVNGLDYEPLGIVLDHQNKDMVLFEGKIGGKYHALTRPTGDCYFAPAPDSPFHGGPGIHIAQSPDALHWKPLDAPGIRARRGTRANERIGGGSAPMLTPGGWLLLYHGVERGAGAVGTYRTFWALLDREEPTRILHLADAEPLIEAAPALTAPIADRLYLPAPVVFTTGMVDAGDHYLVASGEADLACRITRIAKAHFA